MFFCFIPWTWLDLSSDFGICTCHVHIGIFEYFFQLLIVISYGKIANIIHLVKIAIFPLLKQVIISKLRYESLVKTGDPCLTAYAKAIYKF